MAAGCLLWQARKAAESNDRCLAGARKRIAELQTAEQRHGRPMRIVAASPATRTCAKLREGERVCPCGAKRIRYSVMT